MPCELPRVSHLGLIWLASNIIEPINLKSIFRPGPICLAVVPPSGGSTYRPLFSFDSAALLLRPPQAQASFHGGPMCPFPKRPTSTQNYTLFLQSHLLYPQIHSTLVSDVGRHLRRRFTTELCYVYERPRTGPEERRSQREKGCLPGVSSLPLPGFLHSPSHRNFHHSHCQIPFLLPYSTSLFVLQEKLLTPTISNFTSSTWVVPNFHSLGNVVSMESRRIRIKGFSSVATGGSDSGAEADSEDEERGRWDGNESVNLSSSADPEEVDRVCKVIDELFALDQSMEAVLDECGIHLSHDLVVAVLKRFQHARKPAFRSFFLGRIFGITGVLGRCIYPML